MSSVRFLILSILMFTTSLSNALPVTGKYFDRAIFVIFENTNYDDALKQPFFKQLANTILITTFDESGSSPRNQIYTSIVGPRVRSGTYNDLLSIPSLLKLMEEYWDLGSLGKKDAQATSIPAIWN